ncbi:TAFII55 protein conserved region-domain-containing protein [Amylostereum chailletii]|nr:TAFII55 protein conserved region-domain-containing protein [Amylostereum chailletii]
MDEDLIVVDDDPVMNGTQSLASNGPPLQEHTASGRPKRAAAQRRLSTPGYSDDILDGPSIGRTTRSHARGRGGGGPAPKLKLKLSEKAAAQAPGMSFLGPYDRELDSDDEELSFEEQFILRMPPGEDCDKLRKMVAAREVSADVWFKFKDSRRAVFHIGNTAYAAKLVDLPCIIESQKTIDGKQMFKVADICQMLLVESRIPNEDAVGHQKTFNIDDFIWPHGITPPLQHVRKRRFRKRMNKRTIESVEQEVERLLEMDATAAEVKYNVLDNVNPDLSDSEFLEREEPLDAPTPGGFSELGDAPTTGGGLGMGDEGDRSDEEPEVEGDIDEELAAELDLALGDEEDDGDDGDEEDEESEEDEDDDDDDDDEMVQARKLLNEEISDLEAAVRRKEGEVASATNPLIRRRFEDALRKLTTDLVTKTAQRDDMREAARRKKEGRTAEEDGFEGSDAEDEDAEEEHATVSPGMSHASGVLRPSEVPHPQVMPPQSLSHPPEPLPAPVEVVEEGSREIQDDDLFGSDDAMDVN